MKHRLVIGIGSQRAGSTLLHHLLSASTEIFMHPVKELHYFDTLYGFRSEEGLKKFSSRQLARQIDRIINEKDLSFVARKRYKCFLRTHGMLAMSPVKNLNYLDLYRPCLMNASLLGEVTPEYMLLDEPSIEKMKLVIGEDAAIILLCRNPVKRFLSAVKLINSYNKLALDDASAEALVQKMLAEESAWLVSQDQYNNYADAITRYSKHFPHFVAISYDEMVTNPEQTAERLADAISIPVNAETFKTEAGKVVNDLGNDFTFSAQIIQQLSKRYRDEQLFLDNFFGLSLVK